MKNPRLLFGKYLSKYVQGGSAVFNKIKNLFSVLQSKPEFDISEVPINPVDFFISRTIFGFEIQHSSLHIKI